MSESGCYEGWTTREIYVKICSQETKGIKFLPVARQKQTGQDRYLELSRWPGSPSGRAKPACGMLMPQEPENKPFAIGYENQRSVWFALTKTWLACKKMAGIEHENLGLVHRVTAPNHSTKAKRFFDWYERHQTGIKNNIHPHLWFREQTAAKYHLANVPNEWPNPASSTLTTVAFLGCSKFWVRWSAHLLAKLAVLAKQTQAHLEWDWTTYMRW